MLSMSKTMTFAFPEAFALGGCNLILEALSAHLALKSAELRNMLTVSVSFGSTDSNRQAMLPRDRAGRIFVSGIPA